MMTTLGMLWGFLAGIVIVLAIQVYRNNKLIKKAIEAQANNTQKILLSNYNNATNTTALVIKESAATRRKIGRVTGEIKTRLADEEKDDQKAKAKARMDSLKKGS